MNVDNELTDFDAAGSLAEELPWWGWLEDGQVLPDPRRGAYDDRAGDA